MIKVDQTCVDAGKGDCQRASVASMLDLDITQVPNFILYPDNIWFGVYNAFLWSLGWQYEGSGYSHRERGLREEDSINGLFEASVPSRTFDGKFHSVLIDINGVVVHDPNPNKKWQDVNVLKSGDLESWYMFSRRIDM